MKNICIRSYSDPHFPTCGLNDSEYGHVLRSAIYISCLIAISFLPLIAWITRLAPLTENSFDFEQKFSSKWQNLNNLLSILFYPDSSLLTEFTGTSCFGISKTSQLSAYFSRTHTVFASIKNNSWNAHEMVNLPAQKGMKLSCKKGNWITPVNIDLVMPKSFVDTVKNCERSLLHSKFQLIQHFVYPQTLESYRYIFFIKQIPINWKLSRKYQLSAQNAFFMPLCFPTLLYQLFKYRHRVINVNGCISYVGILQKIERASF